MPPSPRSHGKGDHNLFNALREGDHAKDELEVEGEVIDVEAKQREWMREKQQRSLVLRVERRVGIKPFRKQRHDASSQEEREAELQVTPRDGAQDGGGEASPAAPAHNSTHQVKETAPGPRKSLDAVPAKAGGHVRAADSHGNAPAPAAQGASPSTAGQVAPADEQEIDAALAQFGDLSQYNRVRRWCIRISCHPDFELVVMLAILANCVTLATYNPLEPDTSPLNLTLFYIEAGLNALFTVEMLLRIFALGGFFSYIKQPWNTFDFFMVAIGYTAFIPTDSNNGGMKALRALRALRPLRTITRFDSLRAIVVCFLEAVPLLGSAVTLLLFLLFIFSVAGNQLFMSVFHKGCQSDVDGSWEVNADMADASSCGWRQCPVNFTCTWSNESLNENSAGFDNTPLTFVTVFQIMTNSGWEYVMYRCIGGTNPAAVIYYLLLIFIITFIVLNLFLAVLKVKFAKAQTIFHVKRRAMRASKRQNTVMSLFSKVTTRVSQYASKKSKASTFHASMQSLKDQQSVRKQGFPKGADASSRGIEGSMDASNKVQRPVIPLVCTSVLPPAAGEGTGAKDAARRAPTDLVLLHPSADQPQQRLQPPLPPAGGGAGAGAGAAALAESTETQCADDAVTAHATAVSVLSSQSRSPSPSPSPSPDAHSCNTSPGQRGAVKLELRHPALAASAISQADRWDSAVDQPKPPLPQPPDCITDSGHSATARGQSWSTMVSALHLPRPESDDGDAGAGAGSDGKVAPCMDIVPGPRPAALQQPSPAPSPTPQHLQPRSAALAGPYVGGDGILKPSPGAAAGAVGPPGVMVSPQEMDFAVAVEVMGLEEFIEFTSALPWRERTWLRLRFRCRLLVTHHLFDRFFMLVIVLNTVVLAMTYNGMSDAWAAALEQANYVLAGLFTIEMLLMLLGVGFWNYAVNGFNLFNASIVIISLLEIALTAAGALSVRVTRMLHGLRVLRLLKFLYYLPALQKVLAILFTTFASFVAITVLVVLFWFVFAVIGLHVFGGLTLSLFTYPNFDTMLNSVVSTLNIFTFENYQQEMYAVVRGIENYGVTVFFFAWIVIGKYILLTLFLAVILEAFESKSDHNPMSSTASAASYMTALKASNVKSKVSGHSNRVPGRASLEGPKDPKAQQLLQVQPQPGRGSAAAAAHLSAAPAAASLEGMKTASPAAAVEAGPGPGPRRPAGPIGEAVEPQLEVQALLDMGADGVAAWQAALYPAPPPKSSSQHRSPGSPSSPRQPSPRVELASPQAGTRQPDGLPSLSTPRLGSSRLGLGSSGRRHSSRIQPSENPSTSASFQVYSNPLAPHPDLQHPPPDHLDSLLGLDAYLLHSQALASARSSGTAGPSVNQTDSSNILQTQGTPPSDVELLAPSPRAARRFSSQWSTPELTAAAAPTAPMSPNGQRTFPDPTAQPPSAQLDAGAGSSFRPTAWSMGRQQPRPAAPEPQPHFQDLNDLEEELMMSQSHVQARPPNTSSGHQPSPRAATALGTYRRNDLSPPAVPASDLDAISSTLSHSFGRASGVASFASPQALRMPDSASRTPSFHPPQPPALGPGPGSVAAYSPASPTASAAASVSPRPPSSIPALPPHTMRASERPGTQPYPPRPLHRESSTADSQQQAGGLGVVARADLPSSPNALSCLTAAHAGAGAGPEGTSSEEEQARAPNTAAVLYGSSEEQVTDVELLAAEMQHHPLLYDPGLDQQHPFHMHLMQATAGGTANSTSIARCQGTADAAQGPAVEAGASRQLSSKHQSMHSRAHDPDTPPQLSEAHAQQSRTSRRYSMDDGTLGTLETSHSQRGDQDERGAGSGGSPQEGKKQQQQQQEQQQQSATPADESPKQPGTATVTGAGKASPKGRDKGQNKRVSMDVPAACAPSPAHSSGLDTTLEADDEGQDDKDDMDAAGELPEQHKAARHRHKHVTALVGKSFWLFDGHNRPRVFLYRHVVSQAWFDNLLLFIIFANCVFMALESPSVELDSPMGQALYISNLAFTAIFVLEALLMIFVWSFVVYIKNVTNIVDFLVVVTAVLEVLLQALGVGGLAAFTILRVLRALRILTRSAGMRQVFKSLTQSLAAMGSVTMLLLLFMIIFSILGVQLWEGLFFSCNDTSVAGQSECTGTYVDPGTNQTIDREWSTPWPNFDNTGNAMLSCFVVATLNGYMTVMQPAMAAPAEVGDQPQTNLNPAALLWFVGYIFIVSFTLLNLYLGVIFNQFSRIRMMSATGSAFLSNDQQEWAELSRMVFKLKPAERSRVPTGRFRYWAYCVTNSPWFAGFMMAVIITNVAIVASNYYGESEESIQRKEWSNDAFLALYCMEALLKIFALGFTNYIRDGWNKLDFMLVVFGLLELVLIFLHTSFGRVLRVLRLMRIVRLIRQLSLFNSSNSTSKRSDGFKAMGMTLLASIPAFANIGALISLVLFMYAYIGVMAFGKVVPNGAVDDLVNFSSFLYALLVLFRVLTVDNWTNIADALMPTEPLCDHAAGNCGPGAAAVITYFVSFIILVPMVLLNLFTAVVIENFESQHNQEEWHLQPRDLEDFVGLWSEYDDGSGTIDPRSLEQLLLRLDPPLGLGPLVSSKDVLRFVYDLDIPLIKGRVPFHKTVFELVKRVSQASIPDGALKQQIEGLTSTFFTQLQQLAEQEESMNFSSAVVVMMIQRKWRTKMRAGKLRRRKVWRSERLAGEGSPSSLPSLPSLMSSWGSICGSYNQLMEELEARFGDAAALPWSFEPQLIRGLNQTLDVEEDEEEDEEAGDGWGGRLVNVFQKVKLAVTGRGRVGGQERGEEKEERDSKGEGKRGLLRSPSWLSKLGRQLSMRPRSDSGRVPQAPAGPKALTSAPSPPEDPDQKCSSYKRAVSGGSEQQGRAVKQVRLRKVQEVFLPNDAPAMAMGSTSLRRRAAGLRSSMPGAKPIHPALMSVSGWRHSSTSRRSSVQEEGEVQGSGASRTAGDSQA